MYFRQILIFKEAAERDTKEYGKYVDIGSTKHIKEEGRICTTIVILVNYQEVDQQVKIRAPGDLK